VGANADLVVDGASGTIVAPSDSDAIARALLHYFRDPARARAHGRAARAQAEQRFSLERMLERYDRLYRTLVASKGARSLGSPAGATGGPLRH
jgi:glycosyltransferase involved in cell wall biosynthesis